MAPPRRHADGVETEALRERIDQLTAARAWPWMRPGALSVGVDDEGRVVRYLATETDLVPVGFVELESQPHDGSSVSE